MIRRHFGPWIMLATLQELENLARERSSEKRRALLHAISDRFFSRGGHSDTEVALYDDVVMRVLDEVEPLARAELAERLADLANPPRQTLLELADDDQITVAEPILSRSPALQDADLERIARKQSQAHLAAIAVRPTLSERVTDVLVDRGDDRVVHTVAGNHGAQFSAEGFSALVQRAGTSEVLLHRLGARADLPGAISTELAPKISAALAAKLKAAGADGSALVGLAAESRAVLADRLRAASKMARPLEILLDHLDRGLVNLDEAIIELADVDATPDVARLIADRIELRSDTVTRALCGPTDEAITLLCRAAGLKVNGYSAIVRMRRRRRRGTESSPAQLLDQYQQIPLEMAQRVLRFLKVRETADAV
jgi:uncharacterized protein (DUF2336 family)